MGSLPLADARGLLHAAGRFSGGSHGFVVGHVSPEAQVGGPIALVENGDRIKVDAETRVIDVLDVSDEVRSYACRDNSCVSAAADRVPNSEFSGLCSAKPPELVKRAFLLVRRQGQRVRITCLRVSMVAELSFRRLAALSMRNRCTSARMRCPTPHHAPPRPTRVRGKTSDCPVPTAERVVVCVQHT